MLCYLPRVYVFYLASLSDLENDQFVANLGLLEKLCFLVCGITLYDGTSDYCVCFSMYQLTLLCMRSICAVTL